MDLGLLKTYLRNLGKEMMKYGRSSAHSLDEMLKGINANNIHDETFVGKCQHTKAPYSDTDFNANGIDYDKIDRLRQNDSRINKLVFQPKVYIIGQTEINVDELKRFREDYVNKTTKTMHGSSPINLLVDNVQSGGSSIDAIAEIAGRICYDSFANGRASTEYIDNILNERHGNVFAHGSVNAIITGISRAGSLELLRHHVGTNPSQESQRYTISPDEFVVPPLLSFTISKMADDQALETLVLYYEEQKEKYIQYQDMRARLKEQLNGMSVDKNEASVHKRIAEASRSHLPNASCTRLMFTMNMRALRWIMEQRGDPHADLEIKNLAVLLYKHIQPLAPLTLSGIDIKQDAFGFDQLAIKHSKV